MSDWTDAEEVSGRGAFDMWRFLDARTPVPWDWADMAEAEKRHWIERALGSADAA